MCYWSTVATAGPHDPNIHYIFVAMRVYVPCTQLEPDPQYPTQISLRCYRSNELGHWIHGVGIVEPDHGYTNIHYEFVVIRTYVSCTKLRWTTRSCSPVSTGYNIHVSLQEQWIVEWWAIASRS